jgi:hypothetical protein
MSPGASMIRSRVFAFWRGSPLIVPRQRITVTRQTIQNRHHVDDAIRAHEAEAVLPEAAQTHLETSVDEKSLRAALRLPWPLYSTRIVCTLQSEALMSLVDVPRPPGEPPEQLRGAARPQRTKARVPWNCGRPMRLASWSPTKPPLEVRPVGIRRALAGRATDNRKHI